MAISTGGLVGNTIIQLTLDKSAYKRDMDQVESSAARSSKTIGDSYDKGITSGVRSGLNSAEREVEKSSSSMGSRIKDGLVQGVGMAVASKGFSIIGGVFDKIKDSAIGMNASLQTSTLQFTTLMGNADEAQQHVKMLFDFAKKTPFETGPIIEASKMLQTFGGQALNTSDNLKLIGDAAAATNAPINELGFWVGRMYSAIQAGKPFGEAAMRLQELAVMTPQARQKMEDLQKSGASSQEVFATFQEMLGKFSGAMERQANTWEGLTSTFSDTIQIVSAKALAPFFELASGGMARLNTLLGGDGIQRTAEGFANTLRTSFKQVGTGIQAVIDLGQHFSSVFNGVATLVQRSTALITTPLSYIQEFTTNAQRDLASFGHVASGTFLGFPSWLRPILPLLGQVLNTIHFLQDGIKTFRAAMDSKWIDDKKIAPLHRVFGLLGETVHALTLAFGDLQRIGHIASGTFYAFPPAIRPLLDIFNGLLPIFKRVGSALGDLVTTRLTMLRDLLHGIGALLQGNVRDAFASFGDLLRQGLIEPFKIIGSLLLDVFQMIDWDRIGRALLKGFRLALSSLTNLGQAGLDLAGDMAKFIGAQFDRIPWGDIGNMLLRGLGATLGTLSNIGGMGVDFAGNLASWIGNEVGKIQWGDTARAVFAGIVNAATTVADTAADIGGTVYGWVSREIGAVNWGGALTTIYNGIVAGATTAITTAADIGTAVYNWTVAKVTSVDWLGLATTLYGKIEQGAASLVNSTIDIGSDIYNWVLAKVTSVDWSGISGAIFGGISSGATQAGTTIGGFDFLQPLLDVGGKLVGFVHDDLMPVLTTIADFIYSRVKPTFDTWRDSLSEVVTLISTNAKPLLDQFSLTFQSLSPILKVAGEGIAGIALVLSGPFDVALAAVAIALNTFLNTLGAILPGVVQASIGIIETFLASVRLIADVVTGVVRIVGDLFHGDFTKAWLDVKALVGNVAGDIVAIVNGLRDTLLGTFHALVDGVVGFFQGLYNTLVGHSIVPDLVSAITSAITGLKDDLFRIWQIITQDAMDVWNGLIRFFDSTKQALIDAIKAPFQWIQDNVGKLIRGGMNDGLDAFRSMLGRFGSFVGGVKGAINWVGDQLGLKALITGEWSAPSIPALATGVQDFAGGYALVGERGPELVRLPAGADVYPADETRAIMRGGKLFVNGKPFAFGGFVDDVIGGVKDLGSSVAGTLGDWVSKGASWVADKAFSKVGGLDLGGAFSRVGPAVISKVKDEAIGFIKSLLDGLKSKIAPAAAGIDLSIKSALGFIKPISGQYTQGFYGEDSDYKSHASESAIDWMAPRGTTFVAPASGVISAYGWNLDGQTGNTLVLTTPDGWEFRFGHVSGVLAQPGTNVLQGQAIGLSGDPAYDGGAGVGAHLHMAVLHNGAYVGGSAHNYFPLANGGIVTQPLHALIGEAGPEAVIPLKNLGIGGGKVNTTIKIPKVSSDFAKTFSMGNIGSPNDIAQAIIDGLVKDSARIPEIMDSLSEEVLAGIARIKEKLSSALDLANLRGDDQEAKDAIQAQLDAVDSVFNAWADKQGESVYDTLANVWQSAYSEDVLNGVFTNIQQNWDALLNGTLQQQLQSDIQKLTDQISVLTAAGAPDAILGPLQQQLSAKQAELESIGQIMSNGVVQGIVNDRQIQSAWEQKLELLPGAIDGTLKPQLTRQLNDLNNQIAVLVAAGAPDEIVDQLRTKAQALQGKLDTVGQLMGTAIGAGIATAAVTTAQQAMVSVIPTILSDPKALDTYKAAADKATAIYQFALTENLPDSLLQPLKDAMDKAQAEYEAAGKALADATAGGFLDTLNAKVANAFVQVGDHLEKYVPGVGTMSYATGWQPGNDPVMNGSYVGAGTGSGSGAGNASGYDDGVAEKIAHEVEGYLPSDPLTAAMLVMRNPMVQNLIYGALMPYFNSNNDPTGDKAASAAGDILGVMRSDYSHKLGFAVGDKQNASKFYQVDYASALQEFQRNVANPQFKTASDSVVDALQSVAETLNNVNKSIEETFGLDKATGKVGWGDSLMAQNVKLVANFRAVLDGKQINTALQEQRLEETAMRPSPGQGTY